MEQSPQHSNFEEELSKFLQTDHVGTSSSPAGGGGGMHHLQQHTLSNVVESPAPASDHHSLDQLLLKQRSSGFETAEHRPTAPSASSSSSSYWSRSFTRIRSWSRGSLLLAGFALLLFIVLVLVLVSRHCGSHNHHRHVISSGRNRPRRSAVHKCEDNAPAEDDDEGCPEVPTTHCPVVQETQEEEKKDSAGDHDADCRLGPAYFCLNDENYERCIGSKVAGAPSRRESLICKCVTSDADHRSAAVIF